MERLGVGIPDTAAVDSANMLLGAAVAAVFLFFVFAMLREWFHTWDHRRHLRKEVEHDWRKSHFKLPPAA